MPKLLRKRKQFGRCSVKGHGQRCFCEVCDEIQGTPWRRSQDKREANAEIRKALRESKEEDTK